jgi:hypothetical protein
LSIGSRSEGRQLVGAFLAGTVVVATTDPPRARFYRVVGSLPKLGTWLESGRMVEVTLPQAAGMLGISMDTVRRRVRRGMLPARLDARGRYLIDIPVGSAGALSDLGKIAELERELARTRDVLAEVRRQRDYLEGDIRELRELLTGVLLHDRADGVVHAAELEHL